MKDNGCLSFTSLRVFSGYNQRGGTKAEAAKQFETRKVGVPGNTVQYRKSHRELQRSTDDSSSRIAPSNDHIYLHEETTWGLGKKNSKQLKVTFFDALKGHRAYSCQEYWKAS